MNQASPYFNDVGMDLVNLLWNAGYPTDLIPTSEIDNGSLQLDNDGWIHYGEQHYAAVVLYHPDLDKISTSKFFMKATNSKTAMFRVGDWNNDFNGNPVNAETLLPETMLTLSDYREAYLNVLEVLMDRKIAAQTPATENLDSRYFKLRDFNEVSKFPPTTGFCRLIDGTVIHVAGTNKISGDPIKKDFKIREYPVSVDAVGVAAVRLNKNGNMEALAAGSLKSFKGGGLDIMLDEPLDMAVWKAADGQWEGIVQGLTGEIPVPLKQITNNWKRVNLPEPPERTDWKEKN
jgi:hypothetical protein